MPQYLNQLADWHQAEWSFLNPDDDIDARILKMQSHLSDELIPSTFIAIDENLLGSAAIVENDMENNPQYSPWLASVYVAPHHRCKGTGAILVKHVMQQAHAAGIKSLYLFTPDKSLYYQNLGWRRVNIEHFHGHEVTIMKVDLNNDNTKLP